MVPAFVPANIAKVSSIYNFFNLYNELTLVFIKIVTLATGLSSNGGLIADGAIDPNWFVNGGTVTATIGYSGGWISNTATSEWIKPPALDAGTYTYTTNVNLTSLNIHSGQSVWLAGWVAAGNSFTSLKINGVIIATGCEGASVSICAFNVQSSAATIGSNQVTATVYNAGGPTGLQFLVNFTVASPHPPEGKPLLTITVTS
jgi:hypothetical protein